MGRRGSFLVSSCCEETGVAPLVNRVSVRGGSAGCEEGDPVRERSRESRTGWLQSLAKVPVGNVPERTGAPRAFCLLLIAHSELLDTTRVCMRGGEGPQGLVTSILSPLERTLVCYSWTVSTAMVLWEQKLSHSFSGLQASRASLSPPPLGRSCQRSHN